MKVFSLSLALTAGLFAQSAVPSAQTQPGTPASTGGASSAGAPGPATPATALGTPPKPVTPDTVVAKVGDKSYTAAEMDKLLADLPPNLQMMIARKPEMLSQMFLFRSLAQQAEFQNLDKQPQVRQQLEAQRMQVLAQAEVNQYRNSIHIPEADQKTWYQNNLKLYQIAKVKAIKISFTPATTPAATAAKPPSLDPKSATAGRTEAEAQAKIDDLRKQIVAGADFSKLAAANSDDKASAEKGGDYGEVTPTSGSVKEREAVFSLKPGEVSEVVKEPGALYLFKLVETSTEPFEKVQSQILQQMQQGEFTAWIKGIEARNKVTVENPGWFATRNAH